MKPRYHHTASADFAYYPELKSKLLEEQPVPFLSCGHCDYASTGFLCYSCEGDCMKTRLEQIKEKKTNEKQLS